MIEANKYKLGIFVITGSLLFFMALLMLGLRELFEPKVRFCTLFNESVQGLEVGASVKFRGVDVGKVSRIILRTEDNYVRVDMEARPESLDPGKEHMPKSSSERAAFFYKVFAEEVQNGLRCRLVMASIATGMKYVELDYFDPRPPILGAEPPQDVLYIPSTRSLMSGISTTISDTFAKLATVDFKKISDEMIDMFKSVNSRINDPKIVSLIEKLEKVSSNLETTTSNVNGTLTPERLKKVADDMENTFRSVQDLSSTLKKQVEDAKIPETASNANRLMDKTGEAAESITEMRREISGTLEKLNHAIDSFNELVNYLEEDPSSVIRGKRKPAGFE